MLRALSPRLAPRAAAAARALSIDASSLRGRDLDTLFSLSGAEVRVLLDMAKALKARLRAPGAAPYTPLTGRTLSMVFQKRSTRTRVSAEGGFAALGGHAIFLGSEDVQLGKNETLLDTARVLGRFSDIVLARVFAHADIDVLCRECPAPVINALSDAHHPLQLLADVQTLEERLGPVAGRTLAWVGDGNNILLTLLSAAGALGYNVRYATPRGYAPDAAVVARAAERARAAGVELVATHDPLEAVRGADAVVTDTWVSMGQEDEAAARAAAFAGYRVTEDLARRGGAKPGWVFLHCLPRKQNEVDDEVFYGGRSLVWDEAENRKWTVMAVFLAQLLGGMD